MSRTEGPNERDTFSQSEDEDDWGFEDDENAADEIKYLAFKDPHGTNHVLQTVDIVNYWPVLLMQVSFGHFQLLLELSDGRWAIYNDRTGLEPSELRDGRFVSSVDARTWLLENGLELPDSLLPEPLNPLPKPQDQHESNKEELQEWLTVSEASQISAVNKGAISRAVDSGELKGKGNGRDRRICPISLTQWQLQKTKKKEPQENPETVLRKLRESSE